MIVSLKNIYKSFDSKKIFEDFSLEIKKGEKIAIIGETGSGKTTLVNLILKNIKPDKGRVYVTDSLSIAFQENRLLEDFTVLENLKIVKQMSQNECNKYLESMNLNGNSDTLVKNLSGGMKRRLSLLRALIFPSELLILDEAVREIDSNTREIILKNIKTYSKDRALIYITHEKEDIQKLSIERIINLDDLI